MRLAVLISGSGTTLQNLIDRIADGRLTDEVVTVVSSRANVLGVERARRAGLSLHVLSPKAPGFSEEIFATLRSYRPDLVVLAGWLHLLAIPEDYRFRVLNIHPALLPAFGGPGMYGARVHQAVLDSGARVSGCTVHFADDDYDTGPIILQSTVPVLDDDTAESLADRVFAAECEAYPEAIRKIGQGDWRIRGRRVIWTKSSITS